MEEYLANAITLADDATAWSVQFYEELLEESSFLPTPYFDPTLEPRLEASARYALGEENAAYILEGAGQRAIHDQSRNTLIENVNREGGRWYRVASPDACGFCRLLATRGPVYKSSHAALASHDRCKCKAYVERPSMRFTPPEYSRGWDDDYRKLRSDVVRNGQKPTLDNIVNAWNRQIRAEAKAAGVALEDVA